MHTNTTYRRGQVDWALWRQFTAERVPASKEAPRVFSTRIKRLLDIDRTMEPVDPAASRFAFIEGEPPGKGTEVAFSAFDAFCLAVGLDMLDAGFKQSEVVFVIKHIRPDLEQHHARILARPCRPDRMHSLSEHFLDMPSFPNDQGTAIADWRVFLILRRVEFVETLHVPKDHPIPPKTPLFMEPVYVDGTTGLAAYLNDQMWQYRKAYIAEIAKPATLTTGFLEQAPEIRRGRP